MNSYFGVRQYSGSRYDFYAELKKFLRNMAVLSSMLVVSIANSSSNFSNCSDKNDPLPMQSSSELVIQIANKFLQGKDRQVELLATRLNEQGDPNGDLFWGLLFGDEQYKSYSESQSVRYLEEAAKCGNTDGIIALIVRKLEEGSSKIILTIDLVEHLEKLVYSRTFDAAQAAYVRLYCAIANVDCNEWSFRINKKLSGVSQGIDVDIPLLGIVGFINYFLKGGANKSKFYGYNLIRYAANEGDVLSQHLYGRASCKTRHMRGFDGRLQAGRDDAGGHFWHDVAVKTNTITPAHAVYPTARDPATLECRPVRITSGAETGIR